MTGLQPQIVEDPAQRLLIRSRQLLGPDLPLAAHHLWHALGDFAHRKDEIGNTTRDRAAGHRGILGLIRILHENQTARFFHCLDAHRTIRSCPRQDDGKPITMLTRYRAEKLIDRRSLASGLVEWR